VAFGLADGKVRVGQVRTNKSETLFGTENGSACLSLAASPDGRALLSGHVDGALYRYVLSDPSLGITAPCIHIKFAQHTCPPSVLSWGEKGHVLAAGSDGRVTFYAPDGGLLRTFDNSPGALGGEMAKDWTIGSFNPSGEAAAVGSRNSFTVFTLGSGSGGGEGGSSAAAKVPGEGGLLHSSSASGGSQNSNMKEWVECIERPTPGLFGVTSLSWKPDGSKLAVGGLTGAADLYDCCLRRTRYKGRFEFTYVSPSTVVVKRLATGMRIVLRSSFGCEITNIRIHGDRYLTALTPVTLLMGDLESCRLSEIPWANGGGVGKASTSSSAASATTTTTTAAMLQGATKQGGGAVAVEKFFFDISPTLCVVDIGVELTLVESGTT